ncbi:MAG TPA: metallophosphoesterase [Rectinemataceae bacterium]|nr:metallophosphoesterase [Rectinemataceae bacterium]
MKKFPVLLLALTLVAGSLFAQPSGAMVTFGLISDTHVCDKSDQSVAIALNASPRYFSGGLAKIEAFSMAMNAAGADFVAELGDFTDNPATPGLTPAQRRETAMGFMRAAETRFALFRGPRYHVFGNHDTDQAAKADFLSIVKNTDTASGASYYSFDRGGVHFIVMDSSFRANGASYSGIPGEPGSGYSWDDANIPAEEVAWLAADIAAAAAPVVVLTHQQLNGQELVDAAYDPKHSVRNAPVVRGVLEASGKVLAVFGGHYHDGGYQEIGGINYIVLQANAAYGNDVSYHNQYATVKIFSEGGKYTVSFSGNGMQRSYAFSKVLR